MQTIRIFGKELTNKSNGNTFIAYSYVNNEGYYNVKFSKKCDKKPTKKGYHLITFEENNYFVKIEENGYKTIWILELEKCEFDNKYYEEKQKQYEEFKNSIFNSEIK